MKRTKIQANFRKIACIALAMLFALLLVLSVLLPLKGKNVSASAAETESRIIDSSWSDFSDDTQYYFADITISEDLEIHLDFSEPSEYYVFVFFGKVRAIEIGIYIDSFELEELNNGIYLDTYYDLNTYDTLKLSFYSYTVSFAIMRTTNPDSYNPDTLQLLYDTLEAAHRYSEEHIYGEAFDSGYNQGYEFGNLEGYYEGYESGKTDGYNEGYENGKTNGYNEGYESGRTDGYNEGYESGRTDGYNEGYEEGKTNAYNEGYKAAQDLYNYGIFAGATSRVSITKVNGTTVWGPMTSKLDFVAGGIGFNSLYTALIDQSTHLLGDQIVIEITLATPIRYDETTRIYLINLFGQDTSAMNFQIYFGSASVTGRIATSYKFDEELQLGYYLDFYDEINRDKEINSITLILNNYQVKLLESLNMINNNGQYYTGYVAGNLDGWNDGYDIGYNVGDRDGYNRGYGIGYSAGATDSNVLSSSVKSFVFALFDAPISTFFSAFNFEVEGFNFAGLISFILTLVVIAGVIKLVV